jgi:hydroxymethylpyrimidine pyrophosphatase-like HAD family hydrolase
MNAYIFDVDGVITNPSLKKVEQTEILHKIVHLLEQNNFVALNTGRSLAWVLERVINPMLLLITDKSILTNFFAVGEKGGTWISFNQEGEMKRHLDISISVPKKLQDTVRTLIENEYSKSMFYDESKETMISTEMNDGYAIEEFGKYQKQLTTTMLQLLTTEKLEADLKVDPTTIATDIENKHVGKDFAIDKIVDWIKNNKTMPEMFIAFGDSESDLPMAERLFMHKLPVELVFVGKNILTKKFDFPVIITQEKFDKGTLEYLTNPH